LVANFGGLVREVLFVETRGIGQGFCDGVALVDRGREVGGKRRCVVAKAKPGLFRPRHLPLYELANVISYGTRLVMGDALVGAPLS
jgi:hypothetical protein